MLENFFDENFEDVASFYRNKLPLGGVKAPFNLSSDKDIYSSPTEEIFHCYIFSKNKKMRELVDILEDKYGELNTQIVYGDTIEFFFNLLSETEIKKLKTELDIFGGQKICKIISEFEVFF